MQLPAGSPDPTARVLESLGMRWRAKEASRQSSFCAVMLCGPARKAWGEGEPEGHRFAHRIEGEIIEHGDIGAGGNGLLQFGQIFDFDLDRDSSGAALGGGYRGGDRTRGHDVIFLDEDSIEQAHA